jgi:hypothetical protein
MIFESAVATVKAYVAKYCPKHTFNPAKVKLSKASEGTMGTSWGNLSGEGGYRINYEHAGIEFEELYHFTHRLGDADMFRDVKLTQHGTVLHAVRG